MALLDIPTLFICFNRIDYVKETFPIILENTSIVYISSEGFNNITEEVAVKAVRDYLIEITSKYPKTRFEWFIRDKNYGCEQNIIDSIKWISSKEKEFIVIEEDVKPTKEFYEFIESNKHQVDIDNFCCISRVLYQCSGDKESFQFNPHGWYTKSDLFWNVFNDWEKYSKPEYLEKIIKYIYKPTKDTYLGLKNMLLSNPFYWDEFYKYSIYFNKTKILYCPDNIGCIHIGKISSNQHGFIWLEDGTFKRII